MWRKILQRVTGGEAAPTAFVPFVGAYGKLPRVGDFVAVRANLEPALAFQSWLGRAVDWGDRRQLPGWPNVFDGRPPAAFSFRPPGIGAPGALVGILRASRDAVGRRFPFAIFSAVGSDLAIGGAHLLPLALQTFAEQARWVLQGLDEAASVTDVEGRLAGLRPVDIDDAAAHAYDSFVRGTLASAFFQTLYGTPSSDAPLYAIKMVREALAPFHGAAEARTEIAVRLPTNGNAYEVAFWLDLIQRLGGRPRPIPSSLFYPPGGPPGRSLYVTLGESHPSLLCEATIGSGDTDLVCDLTVRAPQASSLSRLPTHESRLEAELRRENSTLVDLLSTLGG